MNKAKLDVRNCAHGQHAPNRQETSSFLFLSFFFWRGKVGRGQSGRGELGWGGKSRRRYYVSDIYKCTVLITECKLVEIIVDCGQDS